MEENEENIPVLIASKPFKKEFANVQKIALSSGDFTIGRSLQNTVSIPFLSISRNHCRFTKIGDNEWYVEDNSSSGIKINNKMLGRGSKRKLKHEDLISLEPYDEFTYKFIIPCDNVFETPKKRMRMTEYDSVMIDNVKLKFEESQKCEIQHIEDKIHNAKQMQTTSIILKEQLQEHMKREVQKLENEFSIQIENLKGEKNEVEKQKASLIEERDAQLANVKNEMNGKIAELMEQIKKHNETEFELLNENGLLNEKLLKEREEFLLELNRESSSKQDMLEKLEAKVREQEEIRIKEKKELEETLRKETEELRLSKEKELKELEKLKHLREIELQQELNNIKKNLAEQVKQTEEQKLKAEQEFKRQREIMKKLEAEDKAKTDEFQKVKKEIEKKLSEAQIDAEKSKVEVQARVVERETELAALAAERIQKQVDQSSEVISTLQDQLEKVKSQLKTVETEKNTLLENICTDPAGEGTSNQETLNNFGELMESELQCSICAELFVEATTLNCSHTFCQYCIATWKKKKKDCPICRSPITSECRSLVLDSFIEKMVQNLTDEMKRKRQEMLESRAELETEMLRQPAAGNTRGSSELQPVSDDDFIGEEEYDEGEEYEEGDYEHFDAWPRYYVSSSDPAGGSDDASDTDESGGAAVAAASPAATADTYASSGQDDRISGSSRTDSTSERSDHNRASPDIDSGWADAGSDGPSPRNTHPESPNSDRESEASYATGGSDGGSPVDDFGWTDEFGDEDNGESRPFTPPELSDPQPDGEPGSESDEALTHSGHSDTRDRDSSDYASNASSQSGSTSATARSSSRGRCSVPGVNGAYYGGYGRCFACGARGHWAPGCPFR